MIVAQNKKIKKWLGILLVLTASIVMIGGITRLTESGLSMVDWRPLMGSIPPLTDTQWIATFNMYKEYPEFKLYPDMTLSRFKFIFFWEYLHRMIARVIGLVAFIPLGLAWVAKDISIRKKLMYALLPLWVLCQAILGWKMVQSGLIHDPDVSHFRLASHLLVAFCFFAYTLWLYLGVKGPLSPSKPRPFRFVMSSFAIILFIQIMYGAFMAGLKAGYGYNTFPLMGTEWMPESVWMLQPAIKNIVYNPFMIQFIHRVTAYILLAMSVLFLVMCRKDATLPTGPIKRLVYLVWLQFILGVGVFVFYVPISLAVLHQIIAVGIIAHVVIVMHKLTYQT